MCPARSMKFPAQVNSEGEYVDGDWFEAQSLEGHFGVRNHCAFCMDACMAERPSECILLENHRRQEREASMAAGHLYGGREAAVRVISASDLAAQESDRESAISAIIEEGVKEGKSPFLCHSFNRQGGCKRTNCRFIHAQIP